MMLDRTGRTEHTLEVTLVWIATAQSQLIVFETSIILLSFYNYTYFIIIP